MDVALITVHSFIYGHESYIIFFFYVKEKSNYLLDK